MPIEVLANEENYKAMRTIPQLQTAHVAIWWWHSLT